jgi:hypothetical protein
MTLKRILWTAAALVLIAIGFVLAQQYERNRSEKRIQEMRQALDQEVAEARGATDAQVDAIARTQGEVVLRAFASGISQAVLAGRRESVEIAAVSLLHVPGISGIHIFTPDGGVIYSSDAKLAATGEGAYRGSWALQATELVTQPSTRPNVIDMAVPITDGAKPQAVVWLEYDIAAMKAAAARTADARQRAPVQAGDTPVEATEPAVESQRDPN